MLLIFLHFQGIRNALKFQRSTDTVDQQLPTCGNSVIPKNNIGNGGKQQKRKLKEKHRVLICKE